jgi:MinD superfamily P-loop ATPase
MNFIKKGIFSRKGDEPQQEQPAESGGVLAVWGSPGSGKTVTAVKLAKALADKKKNVVLLLCDMTAPMLPCICPPSELECEQSLGGVLAVPRISDSLIKNHCVTLKRMSHLTLLGMKKGENEYTYPPYTEQQATELLDGLRELAPYIIVDCGSYIANDILSAVALMEADSVLRLANCDLKSVGYFSSQLLLLKDSRWDADKQYKVASNLKPQQAAEHIGKVLGSVAFKLPYSQELEEQYLAGNLLADLTMKDSRPYRKELEKIIGEVFSA